MQKYKLFPILQTFHHFFRRRSSAAAFFRRPGATPPVGDGRGAIVRYFPELQHRGATAENTATCYAQAIETFIRHTPR